MRRLLRDTSGQAAVEFAVTLPIFLLLILGVIYFGKAFYKEQQVQIASRYVCWKAGRHDASHNVSQAAATATSHYNLDGASISGSGQNGTLEDLSDFGSDLFSGFGDPSSLPTSLFSFNTSQIFTMVGTGIAQVDTEYQVQISQPMGTSLLDYLSPYDIDRSHVVAIGNWDYEEIDGDLIIQGYEAYLDIWAWDEIYGML